MSELPVSWVSTSISAVTVPFETLEPTRAPNDQFTYVDIGAIDNLRQEITLPKIFNGKDAPSRARRVIRAGDTLFSTVRTYLKNVALVPTELDGALTSTGIAVLRPHQEIDPRYLFHWVRSDAFIGAVGQSEDGTMYPAVRDADVSAGTIPLAPSAEQRRIVAKLDSLRARSTRARQELDHIPKLIERYKQAILAKAFSGELTADWRKQHTTTTKLKLGADGIDGRAPDLSELPDGWCWTSIAKVADVGGGLTKNAKRASIPTKTPYLRVANVYANELRLEEIAEIGCTAAELEKTRLQAGDLLIVEGNGSLDQIGRVALWNDEVPSCSHQNHIIRARPRDDLLPRYALYWLLSPLGRTAIEQVASSSSGLHTLSISKVSALPIPVCRDEEQREVVRRIDSALTWLDKIATEHARAAHLLPKLDQAILAKAFRGELVPQDPNDEPASELLERIKAEREGADVTAVGRHGRRQKN